MGKPAQKDKYYYAYLPAKYPEGYLESLIRSLSDNGKDVVLDCETGTMNNLKIETTRKRGNG